VCVQVGTYQIALCAQALKTPFYVAVESYKFSRRFPLSQKDVPSEALVLTHIAPLLPKGCKQDSPKHDYTPPTQISLLITDFGVLTPAAVSDELIQLYI
jgi:translation initiation factor eIF-2B subunit alpha